MFSKSKDELDKMLLTSKNVKTELDCILSSINKEKLNQEEEARKTESFINQTELAERKLKRIEDDILSKNKELDNIIANNNLEVDKTNNYINNAKKTISSLNSETSSISSEIFSKKEEFNNLVNNNKLEIDGHFNKMAKFLDEENSINLSNAKLLNNNSLLVSNGEYLSKEISLLNSNITILNDKKNNLSVEINKTNKDISDLINEKKLIVNSLSEKKKELEKLISDISLEKIKSNDNEKQIKIANDELNNVLSKIVGINNRKVLLDEREDFIKNHYEMVGLQWKSIN